MLVYIRDNQVIDIDRRNIDKSLLYAPKIADQYIEFPDDKWLYRGDEYIPSTNSFIHSHLKEVTEGI